MRREHGELDALARQHVEGVCVHRGLRKPEAHGVAPEPAAEVRDPPPHLGHLVAPGRQRQDQMVIRHGDRSTMSAVAFQAQRIPRQHRRIGAGRFALEPRQQRGTKIEIDRSEGVDDVGDAAVGGVPPGGDDGAIALLLDALIPVVGRGRRCLPLDQLEPRVLARRLVEVPVDHHGAHGRQRVASTGPGIAAATDSSTSGNTASRCASSAAKRCVPSRSPRSPASRRSVSSQCPRKRRSA